MRSHSWITLGIEISPRYSPKIEAFINETLNIQASYVHGPRSCLSDGRKRGPLSRDFWDSLDRAHVSYTSKRVVLPWGLSADRLCTSLLGLTPKGGQGPADFLSNTADLNLWQIVLDRLLDQIINITGFVGRTIFAQLLSSTVARWKPPVNKLTVNK